MVNLNDWAPAPPPYPPLPKFLFQGKRATPAAAAETTEAVGTRAVGYPILFDGMPPPEEWMNLGYGQFVVNVKGAQERFAKISGRSSV